MIIIIIHLVVINSLMFTKAEQALLTIYLTENKIVC